MAYGVSVRQITIAALQGGVALFVLASATMVQAQVVEPAKPQNPVPEMVRDSDATDADVIVTGTLLRGVAPTGTNVISVTQTGIQATGATSTNEVLSRIPQISSNFNRTPTMSNGDFGVSVYRPNIRNLGGSGTNTTLVLIDGHRAVGTGILSTTPDPDVVPPGLLERVEIVPDGGSSIYGSDAIGGVINFITRKRFDGLEVTGRYGFADDYYQLDTNVTAGRDWGSGSLFASYNFAKHDAILGLDRDYVRQISQSNACNPGTISITSGAAATFYALPGRVAGTQNLCDTSDNQSIIPFEQRHSAFAGLSQKLNDTLTVDVRAFYTSRATRAVTDQFRTTGTIRSTNPFFVPIGAGNTSQSVAFSYASVYGPSNISRTNLDEWGVTPSITANIGGNWQLRVMGNYGRSDTLARNPRLNTTLEAAALAGTTSATALNPYNLSQTSPSVLAGLRNYEQFGDAKQDLAGGRAIIDGTLFALPGGDVRVAIGGEYNWERFAIRTGSHVVGDPTGIVSGVASRSVRAAFGEVAIPVFGAANGFTGMQSLTLSASGRYDDYSDVGGTFNPKFGATWKPINGITVRGNYGTSFNAPSLADTTGALDTRLQVLQVSPFVRPGDETSPFGIPTLFRPTILIAGGNPNLKPQEADTYSIGLDLNPAFLPGSSISGTYYNVDFTNQISLALPGPLLFTPTYAPYVFINPTIAQINAAAPGYRVDGAISVAALYANPALTPYLLYDLRRNNLGSVEQDGIDFNVSYAHDTGFGAVNASFAGTYTLNRKVQAITGAPISNDLAVGNSRFSFVAGLGARVGSFNAQANLYHSAGYSLGNTVIGQTHVKAYDTLDLFFTYDVKGNGVLQDLALTLNINNVLDQDPPYLNSGTGYTNGSTLGRLFQFGIRKKF